MFKTGKCQLETFLLHELTGSERKDLASKYSLCIPVKAAILNVDIGMLFDPEIASKLKQSEETCVKCSKRISDAVERQVEALIEDDVNME